MNYIQKNVAVSCKRYPPSLPYIIIVQTCGKRWDLPKFVDVLSVNLGFSRLLIYNILLYYSICGFVSPNPLVGNLNFPMNRWSSPGFFITTWNLRQCELRFRVLRATSGWPSQLPFTSWEPTSGGLGGDFTIKAGEFDQHRDTVMGIWWVFCGWYTLW